MGVLELSVRLNGFQKNQLFSRTTECNHRISHECTTTSNFQELGESRLCRIPYNWEVSPQDLHIKHVKQSFIETLRYRN